MNPAEDTKAVGVRGFALRVALFYAAMFFGFGLHQPFFPVWLQARELGPSEIGLVLAAGMGVRLIATPLIAYLADRGGSLKLAIFLCAVVTGVAYIGVGLSQGLALILIGVMIAGFTWNPMMPITDAYALAGLARRGLDYGRIRVWGSVSFMVANVVGGLALVVILADHYVWVIAASFVPLIMAAYFLPDEPKAVKPVGGEPTRFFDGRFVLVVVAVASLQGAHVTYHGFSAVQWKAQGFSGATVGALWALSILAEIVLFWVAGRFTANWRPTTFLMIGGVAGLVRWIAMASDPGILALVPLQILHALSFGLVHLGTMAYVTMRVPAHARASGQGMVSVGIGATMAGATLVAGTLYGMVGPLTYLAMAALSAQGLVLALIARSLPRRVYQPQSEEAGG